MTGRALGDREASAARVRAFGRAAVDARHDGDDPQPRAERRDRGGARRRRAGTRASRTIPTGVSSRCTATSCSSVPSSDFEQLLRAKRMAAGVTDDSELDADALRTLTREYKTLVRTRTGTEFPQDPPAQLWGAIEAVWRSWTLKKAVDYRRVNGIPEIARHRGERAEHGVRQRGRRLRHRRRLHARSVHRRAALLRRVPRQRAGRGRRGRHPHAAPDRRDGATTARRVQGAAHGAGQARAALPRHAGPRVHRGARHALPAADAHRQAHRGRGGAHRGRDGAREADHARRKRCCACSRCSSTSCCTR